jgi:hypothetical protein
MGGRQGQQEIIPEQKKREEFMFKALNSSLFFSY